MDFPSGSPLAGFVLTGGRSSRMGRDKALLPVALSQEDTTEPAEGLAPRGAGRSVPLVARIACRVRAAAGSATLIGAPGRYRHLGFPVTGDLVQGAGPIGGLYTALRLTRAEWNLVVACDMPGLTVEFLKGLLDSAASATGAADCVIAETSMLHPLCAVYHRRALPAIESAVARKCFKMHDLVRGLRTIVHSVDPAFVSNVNTPADWAAPMEAD